MYTGRSGGCLGKRVVLDLARQLQKLSRNKYHLYRDNFFSSVSLLKALLQKGLYAFGMARQNYKGFPTALKLDGRGKSLKTMVSTIGKECKHTDTTVASPTYMYTQQCTHIHANVSSFSAEGTHR